MNKQEIEYAVNTLDLSNEEKVKIFDDAFKIHRSNVFSTRVKALVMAALLITLLCVQWNKIVDDKKSIAFLKQVNSLDSARNYNNEVNLSGTCKKMNEMERQAIYDSIMKKYGFHLEDLNSEHNKKTSRRNWTNNDFKYQREAENESKKKN